MDSFGARRRTILLVDDDVYVTSGVGAYLKDRHLDVTAVSNLASARDLLHRHCFDAILLDLDVGTSEGLALAREIGLRGEPPLIMISGCATETDRIIGLELGADDYLTKPFGFGELYARLRSIWRRLETRRVPHHMRARFSHWCADLAAHDLHDARGHHIRLTAGEATLLKALLEHPGVALTRHDLLRLTDRNDTEVFERVIDVLIGRVRRKLRHGVKEPALIETVRGRGYRLNAQVAWEDVAHAEDTD